VLGRRIVLQRRLLPRGRWFHGCLTGGLGRRETEDEAHRNRNRIQFKRVRS
jgi:hypothetical protein